MLITPEGTPEFFVIAATLVQWFMIDTAICIAHPPDDDYNYLWN